MRRYRRRFLAVVAIAVGCPSLVHAQAAKPRRIGLGFQVSREVAKTLEEAFREGLREQGYAVGRDLILDVRYADGDRSRLPGIVDELIALKPEVLAGFESVAQVMQAKTSTIPIVLTNSSNPVAIGLARSLRRPGGNVTGVASLWEELPAKQIEILREILPRLSRIGLLLDTTYPGSKATEEVARKSAATVGARIVTYSVRDREELDQVLARIAKDRPEALMGGAGGVVINHARLITEEALRLKIPSLGSLRMQSLFYYGPSLLQAYRDAAKYVDRILKGAKAAELPIEQPTRFELVVNLKVARAIGVRIPASVLGRADQVIE